MAEKFSVAKQTEVRGELYDIVLSALNSNGYETETVSKGSLINLGEGQYARVQVSYCDPTKFDIEAERTAYSEKLAAAAARKEAQAQKAREKAEKAAAKAAKAAAKDAE